VGVIVVGEDISLAARGGKTYEESLENGGVYNRLVDFLHREKDAMKVSILEPKDFLVLFLTDLPISMLCFWLAMWLVTKSKSFSLKQHLWFLLIFNIAWFISLIGLKVCWGTLDFLIVRIRPELRETMIDGFSVFVLVTAILLYIWLLARSFTTGFYGSVAITFVFHLIYFLFIFCFMLVVPRGNQFFDLTSSRLGARAVVRSYLSDVGKITSGLPIPAFLRFRPYHL
jgi:hypothetical protein